MRKESLIVLLAIMIITALSLFQIFVYQIKTPEGFFYPLVHNYEKDYYYYLSYMEQGWEGRLFVTSRYTPEQFPAQFVFTFFPILGMVARLGHVSLPVIYTLARFIFGAALLMAGYFLTRYMFIQRSERLVAIILMIVVTPFWYWDSTGLHQWGEFWTGFDPILRVTFLPHHLFANAMMIGSLLLFYRGFFLASFAVGVAGGWANPFSLVILLLILGTATIVSKSKKYVTPFIIFTLISAIPLVWMYRLSTTVFPWTAVREWEEMQRYPMNVPGLLGALGIGGILAILALPIALRKRTFLWTAVVTWFWLPLVGLAVSKVINFSLARFVGSAQYIPTALLATLLISKMRIRTRAFVIFLVVTLSLPSFMASVTRQLGYVKQNQNNPLIYVRKDFFDVTRWLNTHGQSDDVVLADSATSTLLPAFTNKRVVWGHLLGTYLPTQKEIEIRTMSKQLYRQYRIKYVIEGTSVHEISYN